VFKAWSPFPILSACAPAIAGWPCAGYRAAAGHGVGSIIVLAIVGLALAMTLLILGLHPVAALSNDAVQRPAHVLAAHA